jgi:hypothetical protein
MAFPIWVGGGLAWAPTNQDSATPGGEGSLPSQVGITGRLEVAPTRVLGGALQVAALPDWNGAQSRSEAQLWALLLVEGTLTPLWIPLGDDDHRLEPLRLLAGGHVGAWKPAGAGWELGLGARLVLGEVAIGLEGHAGGLVTRYSEHQLLTLGVAFAL